MSAISKQWDMFSPEAPGPSHPKERLFVLEIPGRLPSWNAVLGMEHWQRYKFKREVQSAFLSALQASAHDSSTRTIFAKSSLSIAAATLESFIQTTLEKRKLKSASKRRAKANRSLFE